MAPRVGLVTVDIRMVASTSLKDKRSIVRTVLDGAHRRFRVAVAETDHADLHQRAELAFTAVAGTVRHVDEVLDAVERFVWSFPELEVLSCERQHLEVDR